MTADLATLPALKGLGDLAGLRPVLVTDTREQSVSLGVCPSTFSPTTRGFFGTTLMISLNEKYAATSPRAPAMVHVIFVFMGRISSIVVALTRLLKWSYALPTNISEQKTAHIFRNKSGRSRSRFE
jgi:hypothetical protein